MTIETPFGPLHAAIDDAGSLTELKFSPANESDPSQRNPAIAQQLAEFFEGVRTTFDLPLAPAGTEFQKRVWAELTRIPYGKTIGSAELAKRVGIEGAARAVGRANATNPIAIVVPCHRVIGADGSLYWLRLRSGTKAPTA